MQRNQPKTIPRPRSDANGEVRHVLPGRLLLFHSPRLDLPPGQHWADDARGARGFAPAFYADLFDYFGVAVVLRLEPPAGRDAPDEYARRRISVVDLREGPAAFSGGGGRLSFAELDRFVRHMDAAPGLVALQCPRGDPHARTLIGNITDPPVAPAPAVTQAAPPAAAVGSVKPPTPKPKPTPAARSMAAVKAAKTKAGNKAKTAATANTSGTAGATATVVEPDNLTD